MHGGLFSEDGVTLEDLRKIDRNRQPPDSGAADLSLRLQVDLIQDEEKKQLVFDCVLALSQAPCVTCSGQIHSRRLVSSFSVPIWSIRLDYLVLFLMRLL